MAQENVLYAQIDWKEKAQNKMMISAPSFGLSMMGCSLLNPTEESSKVVALHIFVSRQIPVGTQFKLVVTETKKIRVIASGIVVEKP